MLLVYMLQTLPRHMFLFLLSPLQTLVTDFCISVGLKTISVDSTFELSMRLLLLASLVVASPHARRTPALCTLSADSILRSIGFLPHVCGKILHGLGLIAIAASPAIAIRAHSPPFWQQPLVMRKRRSGFALPAARATLWRTTTPPPYTILQSGRGNQLASRFPEAL